MKRFAPILLLINTFFSCFFSSAFSQTLVNINGLVYDKESKLTLPHTMIINKRTNVGVFSNNDGEFSTQALRTDTLIVSAYGYKVKKITFKDSLFNNNDLSISLEKIYYTIAPIEVYPSRSMNDIERDLDKIGSKNSYTVYGLEAFQSPITYLYERFSKFGKSKQKVAAWENEDLKRDLLKELFRLYIKYDIIKLNTAEFDAFIKYLNFSDEFIKNSTQLELVLAIKGKYETFVKRWK